MKNVFETVETMISSIENTDTFKMVTDKINELVVNPANEAGRVIGKEETQALEEVRVLLTILKEKELLSQYSDYAYAKNQAAC